MKKVLVLNIVLLSILFIGCSDVESTPKCADDKTQILLTDIIDTEVKNYTEQIYTTNDWDELDKMLGIKWKDDGQNIPAYYKNKIISRLSFTVTDIRTTNINKEVKMSQCGATLLISGSSIPIRYLVQYTENGKLYIEVKKFF